MADHSAIEWTDATWNPVRGCTKISPGCAHCYAETFAERFRGVKGHPYEQGFDLRLVPEQLAAPLSWTKPRRVFVNSMSDLFQDGVPDQFITDVFGIMFLAHWHTFQVLTKRPQRMRDFLSRGDHGIVKQMHAMLTGGGISTRPVFQALDIKRRDGVPLTWPPPNVWLGVSVENKRTRDERIPALLKTPAAVHFISAEPLLEEIANDEQFTCYCVSGWTAPPYDDKLDWVIVGGESGPGARPFDIRWARSIVTACQQYDVPVFVKQLGAHAFEGEPDNGGYGPQYFTKDRKGGDLTEWPEDLRVREYPGGQ